MTALAENIDNKRKDGILHADPVLADQVIYKGAPVIIDATSGLAETNDGSTIEIANGDIFAGMAAEKIDATGDTSGDQDVRCERQGIIEMTVLGTVTQAKRGDKVYLNNVSDNAAFTLTSDSGNPQITAGELVRFISATLALVDITGYVGNVAANGA